MIVRIIKEICLDESIDFTAFSYGWVLRLQKGKRLGFVFGYNFGANNAASARICDDKSAASDILLYSGVPAVEHLFFMRPGNLHYIGEGGNWDKINALFVEHETLVCKANEGTGGNAVFLVKDKIQLEHAVHTIFKEQRSMAVSPFYDIQKEYRAIVLNGSVKLVYAKNVPYVVGDGTKSLLQLMLEFMTEKQTLLHLEFDDESLKRVLKAGEVCSVHWKSNLGQGASPELVKDEGLLLSLSDLALQAAKAIAIGFASVDIVSTPGGMRVLEVNCGIMMEHFIRCAEHHYGLAKEIYREAVHAMMQA